MWVSVLKYYTVCISVIFSQVHLHCDSPSDAIDFVCKGVNQLAYMAHRIRISKELVKLTYIQYVLEKSNTLASQANSTDLFWTKRMETLTEVWTDDWESREVALHGHILTALREQLLKHTCVETGTLQACQLKRIFCISKMYAFFKTNRWYKLQQLGIIIKISLAWFGHGNFNHMIFLTVYSTVCICG